MSTLNCVLNIVKKFHKKSDVPFLGHTKVGSPLYSGQFCYCLDEIQWYEKYHDFIKVEVGDDFNKIQPAIRIRDFENILNGTSGGRHLSLFTLSTITGGLVVKDVNSLITYQKTVKQFLDFLLEVGLDLSRLKITYFGGNTADKIEASRKCDGQKRRVIINNCIPEDDFRGTFLEFGIKENQLEANSTRDNYLTSNWYESIVPWGYRNEFLYQLSSGEYLDIGTIERLNTEPIVRKIDRENLIIGIKNWGKSIIIDAIGIERIIMAIECRNNVFETSLLQPLNRLAPEKIEALRTLHRVFTDLSWDNLGRHKRVHIKVMMRLCADLDLVEIEDFLKIHAERYRSLFPELTDGVNKTITEIVAYRKRVGK